MSTVDKAHPATVEAGPVAFVDLQAQHLEVAEEVERGFASVMARTAYIGGPEVAQFESAWAAYCEVARAVGVASGTDALELALRALGVGPGDEVIVPANSFIASAGAVARTGATPVFVDCDDRYLLIDPDAAEAAVTPRTRAIMPVHLYGQLAPMAAVEAVARRHDLAIVEDAAQAHGARQDGRAAGAWGEAAASSFYPGKNLGAYGDAGAVMTRSEELANRVVALRNHGSPRKYEHPDVGFNSRLDTLQAVVLQAKLGRLEVWNAARRAAADRYAGLLGAIPGVRLPEVAPGNLPAWHLYTVRVAERDRVLAALADAGIGVGIHYPQALHLTGAFAGLGQVAGSMPVAEAAVEGLLSLPMHPHLTEAQQARVATVLSAAVRG